MKLLDDPVSRFRASQLRAQLSAVVTWSTADERRAADLERLAARAATMRDNARASTLYALAECVRQGVPAQNPAPRRRPVSTPRESLARCAR